MTTAAEITHLQEQGLYTGANEHDACGVGFVAHIKGEKSHTIVGQALKILENLDHRGAVGADKLITPHPLYWELGNTPFARDQAYAEMVRAGVSDQQQRALTDATLRGWALGEPDYVADLQRRTERRVQKASAGRPVSRKAEPVPNSVHLVDGPEKIGI